MEEEFFLRELPGTEAETLRALRASETAGEQYGLRLTETEMRELAAARGAALAAAGRVEFGAGILPRLALAFCDSPFIQRDAWAETLGELQEAFYAFKSEAEDRLTDDELLEAMVCFFNGEAQGSVEYLTGTALNRLCRALRLGPGEERE